jgi:hypothetical protein
VRLIIGIASAPLLLVGAALVFVGGSIFALADEWDVPALGAFGFAIALPGAFLAFVGHLIGGEA